MKLPYSASAKMVCNWREVRSGVPEAAMDLCRLRNYRWYHKQLDINSLRAEFAKRRYVPGPAVHAPISGAVTGIRALL